VGAIPHPPTHYTSGVDCMATKLARLLLLYGG
jgi:hypothetical protein